MKTIEEVMKYCEHRSGVRLVDGCYLPFGGGLFALELAATSSGHHNIAYEYRQQRSELQLLMYELTQ